MAEKSTSFVVDFGNVDDKTEKRRIPKKTSVTLSQALKTKYLHTPDISRGSGYVIVFQGRPRTKSTSEDDPELAFLTNACLSNSNIRTLGCDPLKDLCPNVVDLDVSGNFIDSWKEILTLLSQLNSLKFVNFAGNKITNDQDVLDMWNSPLPEVENLVLNRTQASWKDVLRLSQLLPSLKELHVCGNGYRALPSTGHQGLHSVECLRMNDNQINQWEEIWKLSHLPNLTSLILSGNPLGDVFYKTSLVLGVEETTTNPQKDIPQSYCDEKPCPCECHENIQQINQSKPEIKGGLAVEDLADSGHDEAACYQKGCQRRNSNTVCDNQELPESQSDCDIAKYCEYMLDTVIEQVISETAQNKTGTDLADTDKIAKVGDDLDQKKIELNDKRDADKIDNESGMEEAESSGHDIEEDNYVYQDKYRDVGTRVQGQETDSTKCEVRDSDIDGENIIEEDEADKSFDLIQERSAATSGNDYLSKFGGSTESGVDILTEIGHEMKSDSSDTDKIQRDKVMVETCELPVDMETDDSSTRSPAESGCKSDKNQILQEEKTQPVCNNCCPSVNDMQPFKCLESLCVSETAIGKWSHLSAFREFPSLRSLRIKNVKLASKLTEEDRRKLFVASLPNIEVLNGSEVTYAEREKSERHFLRHFCDKKQKPDMYHLLEKKHGKELLQGRLCPLVDIDISKGYQDYVTLGFVYHGKLAFTETVCVREPVGYLNKLIKAHIKTKAFPAQLVLYHKKLNPNHDTREDDFQEIRGSAMPMSRLDFMEGDEIHIDDSNPVSREHLFPQADKYRIPWSY